MKQNSWASVTCQIRQLEQPICSKPDKRTRSPLRHERLVEDVRSGSRPGEKHYCRVPHFTSGDIFNKNIRIHAVEMGFAISVALSHPLGVTGDAGKALPVEREDDIFAYVHGGTCSQRRRVNACKKSLQ
ncbi:DNA polymerase beta-like isoform X1 [Larus michahellis]|uniref:DNA polymerase beta-like isoform X1 n=1 Tax=Larus michahellis TaxID=119627 RepID=UPI003D9BD890